MITDPQHRQLLEMALVGYEAQLAQTESSIAYIRKQLHLPQPPAPPALDSALNRRTQRRMSPAARRRIAASQKTRWAEYRRKKALAEAKKEGKAKHKRK